MLRYSQSWGSISFLVYVYVIIFFLTALCPCPLRAQTSSTDTKACIPGKWCNAAETSNSRTEYLMLPGSAVTQGSALAYCLAMYGTLISIPEREVREELRLLLGVYEWAGSWSGLQYIDNSYAFTDGQRFQFDALITSTESPCYTFQAHDVGIALSGDSCDSLHKIACQRRDFASPWEAVVPAVEIQWIPLSLSHAKAKERCEQDQSYLGYIPTKKNDGTGVDPLLYARTITTSMERYFTAETATMYDTAGYWINIHFVNATYFQWGFTGGQEKWAPAIDTYAYSKYGEAASCVMVTMFEQSPRFRTTLCNERRPFICSREVFNLHVGVEPRNDSEWFGWMEPTSGSPYATRPIYKMAGRVVIDRVVDIDIPVKVVSSDPDAIFIEKPYVVVPKGSRYGEFLMIRRMKPFFYVVIYPFPQILERSTFFSHWGHVRGPYGENYYSQTLYSVSLTPIERPSTPAPVPSTPGIRASYEPKTMQEYKPCNTDGLRVWMYGYQWYEGGQGAGRIQYGEDMQLRQAVQLWRMIPEWEVADSDKSYRPNVEYVGYRYLSDGSREEYKYLRRYQHCSYSGRCFCGPQTGYCCVYSCYWSCYCDGNRRIDSVYHSDWSVMTLYLTISNLRVGHTRLLFWYTTMENHEYIIGDPPTRYNTKLPNPHTGEKFNLDFFVFPKLRPMYDASVAELTVGVVGEEANKFSIDWVYLRPNFIVESTRVYLKLEGSGVWLNDYRYLVQFHCTADGLAALRISVNATEQVAQGTYHKQVWCISRTKFVSFGNINEEQLQGEPNKQILPIYLSAVPSKDSILYLKAEITDPGTGNETNSTLKIVPSWLEWRSTSGLLQSVELIGLQEGRVIISFNSNATDRGVLKNSAGAQYDINRNLTLTVLKVQEVAIVEATNIYHGVGGSVSIDVDHLPAKDREELVVNLFSDGFYFVPDRPFWIGGTKNETKIPIRVYPNRPTTSVYSANIYTVLSGSAASQYKWSTNLTLTVLKRKEIDVPPSIQVREGLKADFFITFSAAPDPNTELLVTTLSALSHHYFVVDPATYVLNHTSGGAPGEALTVKFTLEALQWSSSELYFSVLFRGTAFEFSDMGGYKKVDVRILPRKEVSIVAFPRSVYAEQSSGRTFFASLTENLDPGEKVILTSHIEDEHLQGIEISPPSFTWDSTNIGDNPSFLVVAWNRTLRTVNVRLDIEGPETVITDSQHFSFDVLDMSYVIPEFDPVMYVGQIGYFTIRLAHRPSSSSGSSQAQFLAATPSYWGMDRSIAFAPYFVRFDATSINPLTRSIRVSALASSPRSPAYLRLSGPASSMYSSFKQFFVEVRQLVVSVKELTHSVIIGDQFLSFIELSHAPTCGYVSFKLSCKGCDAFTTVPKEIRWTATTPLRLPIVVAGEAIAPNLPIEASAVQSCGEGNPIVEFENVTTISVVTKDAFFIPPEQSVKMISVGGLVPLRLCISPASQGIAPLPTVYVQVSIGSFSTVLTINNYTRGADFTFTPTARQDSLLLTAQAINTRRLSIFYHEFLVVDRSIILVTLPNNPFRVSQGNTFSFLLYLDVPEVGALHILPQSEDIHCEVPTSSGIILTKKSRSPYDVSCRALHVNSQATISFLLSGDAQSLYHPIPNVTIDVMQVKTLSIRTIYNVTSSELLEDGQFDLAAGSSMTVYVNLTTIPNVNNSVVWAIPSAFPSGYVSFYPTELFWLSTDDNFGKVHPFVVTGLKQGEKVGISFSVYSLFQEYVSPSPRRIFFDLRETRDISFEGHMNAIYRNDNFSVAVTPKPFPKKHLVVEVRIEGLDGFKVDPPKLIWDPSVPTNQTQYFVFGGSENVTLEKEAIVEYVVLSQNNEFASSFTHSSTTMIMPEKSVLLRSFPPYLVAGEANKVEVQVAVDKLPAEGEGILRVSILDEDHFPLDSTLIRLQPDEVQFGEHQRNKTQTMTVTLWKGAPRIAKDFSVGPLKSSVVRGYNFMKFKLHLYDVIKFDWNDASDGNVYVSAPQMLELTPSIAPPIPISFEVRVICEGECEQNFVFPEDYTITPNIILWDAEEVAQKSVVVVAMTPGKKFKLHAVPIGEHATVFEKTSIRTINFPPSIPFTIVSIFPTSLYKDYQYTLTIDLDYYPELGWVDLLPLMDRQIITWSSDIIRWAPSSPARRKTVEMTGTTIASAMLDWRVSADFTERLLTPSERRVEVVESRVVTIVGVRSLLISRGAYNKVTFDLSQPPSQEESLEVEVLVNDTAALEASPKTQVLSGRGSESVLLRPKFASLKARYVEIQFNTISSLGRYVPSQRSFIITVVSPKKVVVFTKKNFVGVGETMEADISVSSLPSEGETLEVSFSFSGAANSIEFIPEKVFFTAFSEMTKKFSIKGYLSSALTESISVRPAVSSEFDQTPVLVPFYVQPTSFIQADVPSTLTTSNASIARFRVNTTAQIGESVIRGYVVIVIVAEPAVLLIEPSRLSFDSNDKPEKEIQLQGRQLIDDVTLSFQLEGEYAALYTPPASIQIDVIPSNTIKVGLPRHITLRRGNPFPVSLTLAHPLEPFEVAEVIPEFTACSTIDPIKIGDKVETVLRWDGENSTIWMTLNPVETTSPCLLHFRAGGNATNNIVPGGLWSIGVTEVPKVEVTKAPIAAFISDEATASIEIKVGALPSQRTFAVELVVSPGKSGARALEVMPPLLSWVADDPSETLSKVALVKALVLEEEQSDAIVRLVPDTSAGYDLSQFPGYLVIKIEKQIVPDVSEIPQLFIGSANGKMFDISVSTVVNEEFLEFGVTHDGIPDSIYIAPTVFIFTETSKKREEIYIESYVPQTCDIIVTFRGSDRYDKETRKLELTVLDLQRLSVSEIPKIAASNSRFSFLVGLPESVRMASIPIKLSVVIDWVGVPQCVKFNPAKFEFTPLMNESQKTVSVQAIVGENCGAGRIVIRSAGWGVFIAVSKRAAVIVTPVVLPKISALPYPLYEDQSFAISVDVIQDLPEFQRYAVGFSTYPSTPCLVFSPSYLVFTGGDRLPLTRVVRCETLCHTHSRSLELLIGTSTSNTSLHKKFALKQIVEVLPSPGVTETLIHVECPTVIYSGDNGTARISISLGRLLNESKLVLIVDTFASLTPVQVNYQSWFGTEFDVFNTSILTVGDTPATNSTMFNFELDIFTDSITFPIKGAFPGGTASIQVLQEDSGKQLFHRLLRVRPLISALSGRLTVINGEKVDVYYSLDYFNETMVDQQREWVNGEHILVYDIFELEENRATMSVRLSASAEFVSGMKNLAASITLKPTPNSSSLLTIFPSSLTWDPAVPPLTDMFFVLQTSTTEDSVVRLDFQISGDGAQYVDLSTIERMSMLIRVHPLLRVDVGDVPKNIFSGEQNAQNITLVAPSPGAVATIRFSSTTLTADPAVVRWEPPLDGNMSNFVREKTVRFYGLVEIGSPATFSPVIQGPFYSSSPRFLGNNLVLVISHILVKAIPDVEKHKVYLNSSAEIYFTPPEALLSCVSSSESIQVNDALGNPITLFGMQLDPNVRLTCVLKKESSIHHSAFPPGEMLLACLPRKTVDRRDKKGYIRNLDVFVDVERAIEIVLSDSPDVGSLVVTPTSIGESNYIVYPPSYAFVASNNTDDRQGAALTVTFTFVGISELPETPLLIQLSGSIREYDDVLLQDLNISVRARVDLTIAEIDPINTINSLQWILLDNRQRLNITLWNRTSEYVEVIPKFNNRDLQDAVRFIPETVRFPPVEVGLELIRTNYFLEIVGVHPAPPTLITLECRGPEEFNPRVIDVGIIRFLPLRQVSMTRINFVDEIYELSLNSRELEVSLEELPDRSDVTMTVVVWSDAFDDGKNYLSAEPTTLSWRAADTGVNATNSKKILFTGITPSGPTSATAKAIRVTFQVTSQDTRYNFSLPISTLDLRVLPRIKVEILRRIVDATTKAVSFEQVGRTISIFSGKKRAEGEIVVGVSRLPLNPSSVVSITPSVLVQNLVTLFFDDVYSPGSMVLGSSVNSGAKNLTVSLLGQSRSVDPLGPIFPPRTTRLLLQVVAPSEFDAIAPELFVNVHDLINFEIHPEFPIPTSTAVGQENNRTFRIRPRLPPPGGTRLYLVSPRQCGHVTILIEGPKGDGESWYWRKDESGAGMDWANVTIFSPKYPGYCTIELHVSSKSTTDIFQSAPVNTRVLFNPKPEVFVISNPRFTPSDVLTKGVEVRIGIRNGMFVFPRLPPLCNPPAREGVTSTCSGCVPCVEGCHFHIFSSVSSSDEAASVNAQIENNITAFISTWVENGGNTTVVKFLPQNPHQVGAFNSLSTERITIQFDRCLNTEKYTFGKNGSAVVLELTAEAPVVFGSMTNQLIVVQILSLACFMNSFFFLGASLLAHQMIILIESPTCPAPPLSDRLGSVWWERWASPFLKLTDDPADLEASLVIGNSMFLFALLLGHFLLGLFIFAYRSRGYYSTKTVWVALVKVRFPVPWIIVSFFYYLYTVKNAAYVTFYSPVALLRALCGVSFIVYGILMVIGFMVFYFLNFDAKYVIDQNTLLRQTLAKGKRRFTFSGYFFPEGKWKKMNQESHTGDYSKLYHGLRPARRWYYLTEFVASFAIAVTTSITYESTPACRNRHVIVLTIIGLSMLTTLALRPYDTPFFNHFFIFVKLLQTIMAFSIVLSSQTADIQAGSINAAEYMALLVTIGVIFLVLLNTLLFFLSVFQLTSTFEKIVTRRFKQSDESIDLKRDDDGALEGEKDGDAEEGNEGKGEQENDPDDDDDDDAEEEEEVYAEDGTLIGTRKRGKKEPAARATFSHAAQLGENELTKKGETEENVGEKKDSVVRNLNDFADDRESEQERITLQVSSLLKSPEERLRLAMGSGNDSQESLKHQQDQSALDQLEQGLLQRERMAGKSTAEAEAEVLKGKQTKAKESFWSSLWRRRQVRQEETTADFDYELTTPQRGMSSGQLNLGSGIGGGGETGQQRGGPALTIPEVYRTENPLLGSDGFEGAAGVKPSTAGSFMRKRGEGEWRGGPTPAAAAAGLSSQVYRPPEVVSFKANENPLEVSKHPWMRPDQAALFDEL